MGRRKANFILTLLITILVLVLSVGCAIPQVEITPVPAPSPPPAPAPAQPPEPINPTWTPPPTTPSENASLALPNIADVVTKVKPSVVAITTEVVSFDFFNRPFTQQGAGSGWILDEDGIIVTNNHVVEGASSITVTMYDGSTYTVDQSAVFTDSLNDLAIIQIDAQNLPAVAVGDSNALRVGEWVVAIGNALGQGIRATEGIISRQDVSIQVAPGQTLYDLIETTAAINPGNSGGPLVNLAGEVIGITSAKIATVGVEGMGYAISTETAIPIIEELVTNGYVIRPWLGIVLYTVGQFAVARYELGVESGVLITQVVQGSPADKAGLKPGDVITRFADEEIATAEDMIRAIHLSEIGQAVPVTYWRDQSEYTTEVIPIESPPR
ncbi:MAG: trypsin-like peptidase domain-containing protein [Chloroflexi bacterium]|nr:trypsin-like peptidase domain-containing protein [Chloroflexota bacterium]